MQVPLKDIVPRNVFILLSRLKPFSNEPRADQKTEEDAEKRESMSWCGALERGEVQLSTMSEGPKLRKKRQRQQATEVCLALSGQVFSRDELCFPGLKRWIGSQSKHGKKFEASPILTRLVFKP